MKVKVTQSCPTLCDPMDCTIHGILQARILEWIASSLLHWIFPTQGLNPGLPHCRRILYQLSHQKSRTNIKDFHWFLVPDNRFHKLRLHCSRRLFMLPLRTRMVRQIWSVNKTVDLFKVLERTNIQTVRVMIAIIPSYSEHSFFLFLIGCFILVFILAALGLCRGASRLL